MLILVVIGQTLSVDKCQDQKCPETFVYCGYACNNQGLTKGEMHHAAPPGRNVDFVTWRQVAQGNRKV